MANTILILLHVASVVLRSIEVQTAWIDGRAFLLSEDGSFPEFFGYSMAVLCAVALLAAWFRAREGLYLLWANVFASVLLDDSLQFHEKVGSVLARHFMLPILPGLRAQDAGELIAWGIVALPLLGFGIWTFLRASPRARSDGLILLLVFALLVFFAVAVDLLHIAATSWIARTDAFFAVLEDGGEMLVLTSAAAVALAMAADLKASAPDTVSPRYAFPFDGGTGRHHSSA